MLLKMDVTVLQTLYQEHEKNDLEACWKGQICKLDKNKNDTKYFNGSTTYVREKLSQQHFDWVYRYFTGRPNMNITFKKENNIQPNPVHF